MQKSYSKKERKKEREGGQVLIREDYTVLFDPLVHYKVKIPWN
jgi:hypothetical protein